MSIGEILKQARSAINLTQEEVAEKLSISRQTISSWENGKSYPDIAYVMALSDTYGITLDSLLKGDAKMMKHLEESTSITRSNKQLLTSIIAFGISLFGTLLVIMMYGGQIEDFLFIPSMLMVLIPLVFVLTVTRCFKLFIIGLQAAFFPKKEISYEMRQQAASLYRLLSKTAAFAAAISVFMALFVS